MTSTQKPVHTLVLDAGPILKNDPAVSILIAKCESLVTVPSVLSEIRDVNARSRVETLLRPFLTVRTPKPESIEFVTEFSRRTGDLSVLSRPDIQVLALAYELELERNNGDWRLRKSPGQRKLNGSSSELQGDSVGKLEAASQLDSDHQPLADGQTYPASEEPIANVQDTTDDRETDDSAPEEVHKVAEEIQSLQLKPPSPECTKDAEPPHNGDEKPPEEQLAESDSSNSEGWITPSNLKNQQAKDQNAATVPIPDDQVMQVATITTDFAMQNVLLQIGLDLLTPSIQRIRTIKTFILRCHACFEKVKDINKQFCPKCGKPTLTRVSCSTNQKGEFKIYLKKDMQWNHRGDRYSMPKPVHGSAHGRVGQGKGGGKGGWGKELILAEDQKEYQWALSRSNKKERDPMDKDYLPGILTGEREGTGRKPKIGAGRNVNSKKRVR
ncbi:hypothetical protein N7G274_006608 [Stereocaulon virgatum]|uniref:20S-pre-rRNA D-site endonuclease NOB1 n=1 Tax=Stereocaulon virgatum TaxID=373712 RepID=A0ABR4A572_9LECA